MWPFRLIDFKDQEQFDLVRVAPRRARAHVSRAPAQVYNLLHRLPHLIHYYLSNTIFPYVMRHQGTKLSASGQELGGDMLYARRLGFSGTPSDLLPLELGKCHYEAGSDGKMMFFLTDPAVVSAELMPQHWSVTSLLDTIAKASPPYHALIDTVRNATLSRLRAARLTRASCAGRAGDGLHQHRGGAVSADAWAGQHGRRGLPRRARPQGASRASAVSPPAECVPLAHACGR